MQETVLPDLVGFSEAEAIYFGNIVRHQIEASKQRKEKKVREKKPKVAKMKRSELLSRLLTFLEELADCHLDESLFHIDSLDERCKFLLEELRKATSGKRKALPGDGRRG